MPKRLVIKVEGLVQGVSFRVGALRAARKLGLSGFVRNEPDGSVLAEVEGPSTEVDQFLDWCRTGPPLAEVSKVSYDEIQTLGSSEFNIL
jgi:acylphosphatase